MRKYWWYSDFAPNGPTEELYRIIGDHNDSENDSALNGILVADFSARQNAILDADTAQKTLINFRSQIGIDIYHCVTLLTACVIFEKWFFLDSLTQHLKKIKLPENDTIVMRVIMEFIGATYESHPKASDYNRLKIWLEQNFPQLNVNARNQTSSFTFPRRFLPSEEGEGRTEKGWVSANLPHLSLFFWAPAFSTRRKFPDKAAEELITVKELLVYFLIAYDADPEINVVFREKRWSKDEIELPLVHFAKKMPDDDPRSKVVRAAAHFKRAKNEAVNANSNLISLSYHLSKAMLLDTEFTVKYLRHYAEKAIKQSQQSPLTDCNDYRFVKTLIKTCHLLISNDACQDYQSIRKDFYELTKHIECTYKLREDCPSNVHFLFKDEAEMRQFYEDSFVEPLVVVTNENIGFFAEQAKQVRRPVAEANLSDPNGLLEQPSLFA